MKPTAASSVIDRKGELLQTHGNDGRAINLGSDQGHNFWEIAEIFQKLVDRNRNKELHVGGRAAFRNVTLLVK